MCAYEVCRVLDYMQACVVAPTYLRSLIGLRSMCRQADAMPAREIVLLGRAR